jgi:hypothetical protein
MAKQPKNKFYPLKGEAEMADELNKIERSRPKGYRDGAPEKPLFKKGQISAKRAYEISDSLKKKAQYQAGAMDFAVDRFKSAKNPAEKSKATSILDGLAKSSDYNYQKSDRLKSRADQAMDKANAQKNRDMPLPSSDGIMGKITNWFNKK